MVLLLAGAACDGAPEADSETPEETLERAASTWNETESFHFVLDLENRTIPLDDGGTLSYGRAEGDIVAPDRLRAQAVVTTPLGNTELGYVAIGEARWLTNPLTRSWEQAPPGTGGDVGRLFEGERGIGARLVEMSELASTGTTTLEGTEVIHLTGTLPGAVLAEFVGDFGAIERVAVELWVGAEDGRIRQIVVHEPGVDGTFPTWTFQFSRFDEPIAIEPPL